MEALQKFSGGLPVERLLVERRVVAQLNGVWIQLLDFVQLLRWAERVIREQVEEVTNRVRPRILDSARGKDRFQKLLRRLLGMEADYLVGNRFVCLESAERLPGRRRRERAALRRVPP